jgi:hypothetical protein
MNWLIKVIRLIPLCGLLALLPATVRAQVGVGTTTPNTKAALDIQSPSNGTGVLIPRLTAAQRTGIASPPQGLMVYQTDGTASGGTQTGFWYYAGTSGGWVYLDPAPSTSGLTLPYVGTTSTSSAAFAVVNTGAGQALSGTVGGNGTAAVRGENTNSTSGSGAGVLGVAVSGYGVRGTASGTNGYGVSGESNNSRGVSGTSASGVGVYGTASNNSNTSGAVVGANTDSGNSAVGVLGTTASGYGVRGTASATGGYGVAGEATDSFGVYGTSDTGSGVYGQTNISGAGLAGVVGSNSSSSGIGVLGTTTSGYGVRGEATGSSGYGVTGVASANNGIGVLGTVTGAATGVWGQVTGTGTGRAAYFGQTNASSSTTAVVIAQSGTGLGLDVTGGAIRTTEVNTPSTGTANMLPLAYGRIAANGTVLSGSGNFTVGIPFSGTGYYEITINSPANLNLTSAVCVASGFTTTTQGVILATASGITGGQVIVNTWRVATTGGLTQPERDFSFVVYRP